MDAVRNFTALAVNIFQFNGVDINIFRLFRIIIAA